MRKLIMLGLMAATVLPAAAPAAAQSRAEIRRDREQLREEQRELRDAQRYGTRRDVREERRDVREARRELREDRRELRADRRYGRYVAPYRGWRYRAVTPGYRLQPNFYGSRYYVSHPVRYHTRIAHNQRWVRYGDDLLLVNVRNGRVLQVVRNYYW